MSSEGEERPESRPIVDRVVFFSAAKVAQREGEERRAYHLGECRRAVAEGEWDRVIEEGRGREGRRGRKGRVSFVRFSIL